ncbi:unnamed protein product, partial [Ectocarpus sp. 12 AP-2014]
MWPCRSTVRGYLSICTTVSIPPELFSAHSRGSTRTPSHCASAPWLSMRSFTALIIRKSRQTSTTGRYCFTSRRSTGRQFLFWG